jgi:hypothetical protein
MPWYTLSAEDAENARANHRKFCEEYLAERIFGQLEPDAWYSAFAEVTKALSLLAGYGCSNAVIAT